MTAGEYVRLRVNVYSEKERGTSFKIYLPRSQPARQDESAGRAEPSALPTGNERILLVEDDARIRRAGLRILDSLGYEVLEAGTGAEALTLLHQSERITRQVGCAVGQGRCRQQPGARALRCARRRYARYDGARVRLDLNCS